MKKEKLEPATIGGGKKANGHKAACKCPICINMKHQTASKKNRRVKRGSGNATQDQINQERADLGMNEEEYQNYNDEDVKLRKIKKMEEDKLRKINKMHNDFRPFYRSDKGRYDRQKIDRFCNNNRNFESCGVFYSSMRGGKKKGKGKTKKNKRCKSGKRTRKGGALGKRNRNKDSVIGEEEDEAEVELPNVEDDDSDSDSDEEVELPAPNNLAQ